MTDKEPRALWTFEEAFMKGREEADYDKNFTLAFLRVMYFDNPLLDADDIRAVIPNVFASGKGAFKLVSKDLKKNTTDWQKALHDLSSRVCWS